MDQLSSFKWGILGTGNIANKMASGLVTLPDANLHAVGSRTLERAQSFAQTYDIPHAYGGYEELVSDPEIDIIYVASPHTQHLEHALLAMKHGKAVLVEKPITINIEQTRQLFAAAKEYGVFAMEAMWTRFLPIWVEIRSWIESGRIGDIRLLQSDFSFRGMERPREHRIFNPNLGGGALLDIGIYNIALAYQIFGEVPTDSSSFAHKGDTGVDINEVVTYAYANGAMATMTSSFEVDGSMEAVITGTKGRIRIPYFWKATTAILETGRDDFYEEIREVKPYDASGLQCQASYVMESLRKGALEHPWMPHSESLRIMEAMDSLRKQWGITYPDEA
ncbi:Gfo/Idh/MocA family oxidoreductase [Pontibacter sp. G13]|uniref:Gfo/Idh/MocA family protein n=1 Tax=Pontibacter sp. G13 TaxID=3074898 RepID=UPI00288AE311|nr:Gfo/Idh/MocA family oxidoreductase [Pontibacter sp. G13]WNJ19252.1 Gfo/Idh/MocA family oxidoreductase [Pontibacter sp. G13]